MYRALLLLPAALLLGAASSPESDAVRAASASLLGPPWISIEHPVSPYDRSARGALLLVHAYHHATPVGLPVRGTAEGLVAGERRSVKLEFQTTSRTGVYALRKQWASEGVWTLVISLTQGAGEANTVSAVVELAPSGAVASVEVPMRGPRLGEDLDWRYPARVDMRAIDTGLRSRAAARAVVNSGR
jgi:hypothetical protein